MICGAAFAGSSIANRAITYADDAIPGREALKLPGDVKPDEIAGVVVDSEGKPLAEVLVDAWTWYTGDETKTNEDGVFRLTPRNDGARYVELRFTKDGYSPHYIVQQPRGVKGFVITLSNKTYMEGMVHGPDGQPVANAKIKAVQSPRHGDGVLISGVTTWATTGDDGRYRMYLFPDQYDVQVSVPKVGVARISDALIATDEAKSLDIELKPGVRFEARVVDANTGAPVEKLVLFNWQDKSVRAISDAAGTIVIDGMLPGKYEFNVGNGVPRVMRGGFYYEHGELGRWWSDDAVQPWEKRTIEPSGWQRNFDGLSFELSVGMKPVTIEVERGVVFSGHVYDPDGKPVAGATVAPARTGSGNSLTGDTRYSVKTKKDGSYRAVMPAGNKFTYNLIAHDGDYQQWRQWANGVSEPLATRPGDRFDNFDLTLTRGATVRGRVVADGDRVIGQRDVRAHAADLRENRYYDPTTKVGEDGSFELKFIRPGRQYIQVSPFWLKAADGPKSTSAVVDLEPGQVLDGIELHVDSSAAPLEPALLERTFRVSVFNSAGAPAVNQHIAVGTLRNPLNMLPLVGDRNGLADRLVNAAVGGHQFTTGPEGVVEIPGTQLFDKQLAAAAVVAINSDLGEGAIGALYADARNPELTLRMAPLCSVALQVLTTDLPAAPQRSHTLIHVMTKTARLLSADASDRGLQLLLPPAEYTITATNPLSKPTTTEFVVPPKAAAKDLEPIRLLPSRLTTLMGKPAPELRGIVEWGYGEPTTLAALRGKIVILDFWGFWCGPCLAAMPKLMKIHDAFPDGDVVILAIHDGTLQNLAQLQERIDKPRRESWDGRQFPFRVAIAGRQSQTEGAEVQANCQAVADYGITAFPTTLLIDKQGNVVGALNIHDIDAARKQIDDLRAK